MKKKAVKIAECIGIVLVSVLIMELSAPTWTPGIKGGNSISELRKAEINGADIEMMIRGKNKDNPAVIFVHGSAGSFWPASAYLQFKRLPAGCQNPAGRTNPSVHSCFKCSPQVRAAHVYAPAPSSQA